MKTRNPYARPARGNGQLQFKASPRPRVDRRLLLLAGAFAVGTVIALVVTFLIARHFE